MKRFLSALAAVVMVMSIIVPGAYAQENRSTDDLRALGIDTSHSVNVRDVVIRDPFVLVSGGIYYMYGTGASTVEGYGCYISLDLETWYGPVNVFEAKDGFDGVNCFWAPNVIIITATTIFWHHMAAHRPDIEEHLCFARQARWDLSKR
jgi:hypothetical protein